MAEVLGTALSIVGAVGVLGQIFSGCITAYSLFTAASNLSRDSEKLICKIKIEEMRLLVWGREWGVLEGKFEEELKREESIGNERLRGLAMEILSELYRTITDFQKLRERYGVVEENGESNEVEERHIVEREKEKGGFGMGKLSLRNELSKRVKWVIGDKEKFTVLLQDLKDYNDGLEQLFPPARLAMLHRTWTNQLLQGAHRDLGKLHMLETASSGVYPRLNISANLKQLRINLDEKETKNFKPTYTLKIQRHALVVKNSDMGRTHGQYKNPSLAEPQEIIVEWVDYDKEDLDARVNHLRRIDDLARMIHSASDRHPDLHTIDCLGYTDDGTSSRYGLIYRSPTLSPSSSTLNELIASNDFRTPDLGDRFKLAHTLSVALWSLHSLDWLHKNLCSSNILFFPSAYAKIMGISKERENIPDISTPYLLGFDASRPDHMGEMSIASRNPAAADLHRHPSSLHSSSCPRKPYCKAFDIYSLGLILLEIGLWKTLQMYHKPHYSAERFRDKIVVQSLVPGLGSKVGRRYREVVERCLGVREGLNEVEAGVLMEFVVGRLEDLRV
ncbi:hypothetical protein NHQ30_006700 [Ciborinia camelliae]|nr:hypothetical protein NHQ30_006700 [Ciborinia camelliae]